MLMFTIYIALLVTIFYCARCSVYWYICILGEGKHVFYFVDYFYTYIILMYMVYIYRIIKSYIKFKIDFDSLGVNDMLGKLNKK